jgi:hypothetical protein
LIVAKPQPLNVWERDSLPQSQNSVSLVMEKKEKQEEITPTLGNLLKEHEYTQYIFNTKEDDMEELDDQDMIVKYIHKKFNTKKRKWKPVQKSLDPVEFQMDLNLSKNECIKR